MRHQNWEIVEKVAKWETEGKIGKQVEKFGHFHTLGAPPPAKKVKVQFSIFVEDVYLEVYGVPRDGARGPVLRRLLPLRGPRVDHHLRNIHSRGSYELIHYNLSH